MNICSCGVPVDPWLHKKHATTVQHDYWIKKAKRVMQVEKFKKCTCGYLCYTSSMKNHKRGKKHKIYQIQMNKCINNEDGYQICPCGLAIHINQLIDHNDSKEHHENQKKKKLNQSALKGIDQFKRVQFLKDRYVVQKQGDQFKLEKQKLQDLQNQVAAYKNDVKLYKEQKAKNLLQFAIKNQKLTQDLELQKGIVAQSIIEKGQVGQQLKIMMTNYTNKCRQIAILIGQKTQIRKRYPDFTFSHQNQLGEFSNKALNDENLTDIVDAKEDLYDKLTDENLYTEYTQ